MTSWNALAIRAFAHAGRVLKERTYTAAAARAAEFLLSRHSTADGGLIRTSGGRVDRDGPVPPTIDDAASPRPPIPGTLEDYAYLAQALLALDASRDMTQPEARDWRVRRSDWSMR